MKWGQIHWATKHDPKRLNKITLLEKYDQKYNGVKELVSGCRVLVLLIKSRGENKMKKFETINRGQTR